MMSFRSIRFSALAVALTLAMPAAFAGNIASPVITKMTPAGTNTDFGTSRFIVTYRDGATEKSNRAAAVQGVQTAASRAGLTGVSRAGTAPLAVTYQRKLGTGADLLRTSRKLNTTEANALMAQLAADPAVAHVQPDTMMRVVGDIAAPKSIAPQTTTPNDPYYTQYQWHFFDATGGANVNNAWDIADGSGVTVAVIDTGITQHPDLDLSLADDGYDFISDSFVSGRATDDRAPGGWDLGDWTTGDEYLASNGGCVSALSPAEDSSWHGTHVSGTIAELTDNGIGMAGIAHNAKVLPVRALGHCGGYTSDIADAIVWASGGHVDGVPDNKHPAQVINMSLGGSGQCSAGDITGQAIAGAISRGTTVVVAAGNSSDDASKYSPASCPGVITVASNGIAGKRAFYSNYGNAVTLSAPGGGVYPNDASSGTPVNNGFVWSSVNMGTTVPTDPGYGGMAGTSQATPHVSGTVAMIVGARQQAGLPAMTPAEISFTLASTARRFPAGTDYPIGAGILDAYAAVNKAVGGDGGGDEQALPLSKGVMVSGQRGMYPGATLLYAIQVPAGARNLNIRTMGGTGDVSLFVKADSAPAQNGGGADFSSVKPGNNEAVVIAQPKATTYYVRVVAVQGFDNVSVMATYTE